MNVNLPRVEPRQINNVDQAAWTRTANGDVLVACPRGHVCDLGLGKPDRWQVDEAGNVTPSIWCRTTVGPTHDEECGWHVFAHLEDYEL